MEEELIIEPLTTPSGTLLLAFRGNVLIGCFDPVTQKVWPRETGTASALAKNE